MIKQSRHLRACVRASVHTHYKTLDAYKSRIQVKYHTFLFAFIKNIRISPKWELSQIVELSRVSEGALTSSNSRLLLIKLSTVPLDT
jgi:hypothetical protein